MRAFCHHRPSMCGKGNHSWDYLFCTQHLFRKGVLSSFSPTNSNTCFCYTIHFCPFLSVTISRLDTLVHRCSNVALNKNWAKQNKSQDDQSHGKVVHWFDNDIWWCLHKGWDWVGWACSSGWCWQKIVGVAPILCMNFVLICNVWMFSYKSMCGGVQCALCMWWSDIDKVLLLLDIFGGVM